MTKPYWPRVHFGDVVKLNTDRVADPAAAGIERYVGIEHIEPEDLRIRGWGLVAEGTTFTNHFRPGQVLFVKRRAYQRKVAVADFEGVCSGDIYVLESQDPDVLLPDLLPFICQTEGFFNHAVGTSAGSLSPRTNWTQLAGYEFALPPLAEQRRIAEILSASWLNVTATECALRAVEDCEKAFLDETVEKLQRTVKSISLGRLLAGSPESGSSAPPRDAPTGHWVLALNALSRFGYVTGELKPVDRTEKMLDAILVRGDLLISRSNTRDRVGFVGIYNGEEEGQVSFPDTMMRLNPKSELVTGEFLELLFQSSPIRREIMAIAAGTSASMKKINRQTLLRVRFPLPGLQQQDEITQVRRHLRLQFARLEQRLRQARTLHIGILSSVFC